MNGSTNDAISSVSPASFWEPVDLSASEWIEHAPFAFWLVDAVAPSLVVELGAGPGFSYLAFCQAIHRLGLAAKARAVVPGDGERVRNTTLIALPDGAVRGYAKIHLFDAFGFLESDTVDPGDEPVTFPVGGTTVGVATCYDIRFPRLFTRLAHDGATVTVVGASWGDGPGKVEQWELLARARALDTTSWVVAVGQANPLAAGEENPEKAPRGVGHSLVAAPDGTVVASLGEAPDYTVVDLDIDLVQRTRKAIPVLANAREL